MAIGNQHQQFPRNQTYIVASSGGEPRRLASTFFSADEPLWSPDGQHVLFLGAEDDKKPVAERYDWWVVPINGEPPSRPARLRLFAPRVYHRFGVNLRTGLTIRSCSPRRPVNTPPCRARVSSISQAFGGCVSPLIPGASTVNHSN